MSGPLKDRIGLGKKPALLGDEAAALEYMKDLRGDKFSITMTDILNLRSTQMEAVRARRKCWHRLAVLRGCSPERIAEMFATSPEDVREVLEEESRKAEVRRRKRKRQ